MAERELQGEAVHFHPRRVRLDQHRPLKEPSPVVAKEIGRLDTDPLKLLHGYMQDVAQCGLILLPSEITFL